jgi:two-component system response regulator HydG
MRVPPLRERGSDVLRIADHELRKLAQRRGEPTLGLAPEAARKLLDYSWPGNVRELLNAIERAVALAEHDRITVADLPDKIQGFSPSQVLLTSADPAELAPLEEVERRYILKVLELVGGNRTRAAEVLGIDRKTLYSKLKSYGEKAPEGG